jgi:hypothetical protein
LKRLSTSQTFVYYLAPRFHKLAQFNEAFSDGEVLLRSIPFSVKALPRLMDDNQHYICYLTGSDARWCSSEPAKIKPEAPDAFLRRLAGAVEDSHQYFSADRLAAVRHDLLSVIETEDPQMELGTDYNAGFRPSKDPAKDIVHLSRTYFNAEPIFLRQSH